MRYLHTYGHPGNVESSIWERTDGLTADPTRQKVMISLTAILGISCEQGVATSVWLATSAAAGEPSVRGKYWERNALKWIPVWMQDAEQRRVIWNLMARDAQLEGVY